MLSPRANGSQGNEIIDGINIYRFRYFPLRFERLMTGEGILANLKKNRLLYVQLACLLIAEFINTLAFIKRKKIDIVNSHWLIPSGFIFALVKNFVNCPHIATAHAADIFTLQRYGKLGKLLCGYIVKRCDMLLPVSSYINTCINKVSGRDFKHEIIPMGVNLIKFKPDNKSKNNQFTFLFVGKLIPKKGVNYLLEAVNILKTENMDFQLIIAGGGPEEDKLKQYTRKSGIDKFVSFYGWVKHDNLPELYAKSDILIIPSVFDEKGETEGMPVVILESLACGIPVIASRISGITDIIKDLYNGWLVDPADSTALAKIMKLVYKNDNMVVFNKNCLSVVSAFSIEKTAQRYYQSTFVK